MGSYNSEGKTPAARMWSAALATAIVAATAILYYIDVTTPRGVIDGIGYAGIAALCSRFGRGPALGYAAVATALISSALLVMPDAGIGIAGELANRFFALLSLWAVALVVSSRFTLQADIAASDRELQYQHDTLRDLFRDLSETRQTFAERMKKVTEVAARTLCADRVAVFIYHDNLNIAACIDAYSAPENKHLVLPDQQPHHSPKFREIIAKDHVVSARDVMISELFAERRELAAEQKLRAIINAGVFLDGRLAGMLAFGHSKPREWTARELNFARSLAHIVALFYLTGRNEQAFTALDNVSEGIYVESPRGWLTYANVAAENMAALASSGATNPSPVGSFPQLSAELYPRPEQPLTQQTDFHQIVFHGRDLEVRRSRLPAGGIVTIMSDATERNAAQKERDQLQARLRQAEKMQAIGQLAGGVAHEFNNILAAVMGFANLLESDLPKDSEQQKFARRILTTCEWGKELVNHILDFTRARDVERSLVDLKMVVAECEKRVASSMPSTTALHMNVCDDNTFVIGNASKLSQVIVNLCINARDSIGARGGSIGVTLRCVKRHEVRELMTEGIRPNAVTIGDLRPDRDYVVIEVSDNGPGIRPELLNRVFEPFFTTKQRHRGTGLGLAVVHGVTEAHEGFCHVESVPGTATQFSMYFPQCRVEDVPETDMQRHADAIHTGTERVLIVDDQQDIVDSLTVGLSRLGYEVVGVNSPAVALDAIEEAPDAWDVIVTDQMMPTLTGIELIQRAKSLRPETKAILCTGFSEVTGEHVAANNGVDAFFQKPVAANELAKSIRALMAGPTSKGA